MRFVSDRIFDVECARYNLRFCCEDCVHHDPLLDHCAHGWPDAEHRRACHEVAKPRLVIFCKEFELR